MDESYYLIDSAEKTSRSASVQETRTLLYLMGQMESSSDVDVFVIDAVNDVVSVNIDKTVYYSTQSKGDKTSSPKSIGADLVTLFKDYLSILDFDCYILSIRGVSNNNLNEIIDNPIKTLHYSNFTKEAQKEIRDSLLDECMVKEYIYKRYSNYLFKIDAFLEQVIILINNDSFDSYIKKIAFVDNSAVSTSELNSIFEDIRAKQLAIKTSCDVAGTKIKCLEDQLKLGRNLRVETINSLVLERITGMSIINKNKTSYYCPIRLINYFSDLKYNPQELTTFLEDCVHELYKAFCNSNLNKEFWNLIFVISDVCRSNKTAEVEEIYEELVKKHNDLLYLKLLSKYAMLYLIANIMEGLS